MTQGAVSIHSCPNHHCLLFDAIESLHISNTIFMFDRLKIGAMHSDSNRQVSNRI